jgi:tetratricopeptide (TPR) repeat protein
MRKPLLWLGLTLSFAAGLLVLTSCRRGGDSFERAMTMGQGSLEKGDATNAISAYSRALQIAPESIDARLNLANAYLLAGNSQAVLEQCQKVIQLDANDPAAYYLMGCAYLRLNQAEQAVQALQQSQKIDPAVDALNFQLGLAQDRLGHLEDAIREFETLLQFVPDHPSAHYQLSRLYQRAGRPAEAEQELTKHQQLLAKNPNPPSGAAAYERCKYTQPRVAFTLEQPDPRGVPVRFVDATAEAFGPAATQYRGPIGVLDYNHDGRNSLFVLQSNSFRLLDNVKGRFTPIGQPFPATGGVYTACLVGDLNNDRFEDVVVLGEQTSHAFRFATNGQFREVTMSAGLKNLKARKGLLADLDFTGKLDLLTVSPGAQGLRVYRNLGNFYFQDNTTNSGLAPFLPGIAEITVADWHNEDLPGVFVTRAGQPPIYFAKQRAGAFVQTNVAAQLPSATVIESADLNNDLLPDLVLADNAEIRVMLSGKEQAVKLSLKGLQVTGLVLWDYDNDGWLDLVAYGSGVRVWRNLGASGFEDVTSALGLDKAGATDFIAAADFDQDGDTDLVLGSPTGLRYWRNDGGNANHQLKLRLEGNRSNASGLGVRVELISGHWRTLRTLDRLPFEIGTGKYDKVEVIKTRWSDLATTMLDVPLQTEPLVLIELVAPSGSCPYLYAWNGKQFRFVTDILGAAPLGLPVTESHYVEQDPEEYLALGSDAQFPSHNGRYELRITEELREVLYLDQAKLVAVDHPAGTLVCATSKMLPGRPFLPHELWTLRPLASIHNATRSDGKDVTEALKEIDGKMVSPVRLREPQLRGLAEPFSVEMDFGTIPVDHPVVLVLNGWLRFGGGMANIAAAIDPTLPFPFPKLEVEQPDGTWKAVAVEVGVPAGKTKTIIVDLENRLPAGARRLRLSAAFELYWDWAALCERVKDAQPQITELLPDTADLRWHGFSEFKPLPEWLPLTPDYEHVRPTPPWSRTPAGWCTRYGPVEPLVRAKDDALALLNGGDELALTFSADRLPPVPTGSHRDFFLYVVGWDKDADFHVGQGWRVEPLPFVGMEDQAYGTQPRPGRLDNSWIQKYNTRWVGPMVLAPRNATAAKR